MKYPEGHPHSTHSFYTFLLLPITEHADFYSNEDEQKIVRGAIHVLRESPLWQAAHMIVTGQESDIYTRYRQNIDVENNYAKFQDYLRDNNESLMRVTERYILYRKAIVFGIHQLFQAALDSTPTPGKLGTFEQTFAHNIKNTQQRMQENDTSLFPLYMWNDMNDPNTRDILLLYFTEEFSIDHGTIDSKIIAPLFKIYLSNKFKDKTVKEIVNSLQEPLSNFTHGIVKPVRNYPGSCPGISHAPILLEQLAKKVVPFWQAGGIETQDIQQKTKK